MRLLHLSDLHISRSPGADSDGVDARAVLAQLLHDCRRVTDVDLVLVSGDVADDGSPEAYAAALDLVGSFARDRGAAQAWCVGNHEARVAFATALGTGHRDTDDREVDSPTTAEACAATSEVSGVRVVTLDSLVPGAVFGRIGAEQLGWLREVLAQPAPAGTVLALHHPPISVSPEWAAASLQDAVELADVLRGSDVHAVLCGHVHAQISGFLGGVPVWVGPGVITRIDLTAPRGLVRAVRGAAATVVDLGGPHSPLFHVLHARDPHAGEQVYLADGTTWQYVDDEEEPEALNA